MKANQLKSDDQSSNHLLYLYFVRIFINDTSIFNKSYKNLNYYTCDYFWLSNLLSFWTSYRCKKKETQITMALATINLSKCILYLI